MDRAHDTAGPTKESASPAPTPAAAVPSAPVPLPVGGLMVGHAEDRAEHEADAMAGAALSRLVRRSDTASGRDSSAGRIADGSPIGRLTRTGGGVIRRDPTKTESATPASSTTAPTTPAPAPTPAPTPVASGPAAAHPEAAHPVAAHPVAAHPVVGGAPERTPYQPAMADLMNMDATAALAVAAERGRDSRLCQDVLLGAFEGDWFKAKDCLVFGRWPGRSRPHFTHPDPDVGLELMKGLLRLRDDIHARLQPIVQRKIKERLGGATEAMAGHTSVPEAAKPKLRAALEAQARAESVPSVPADKVTGAKAVPNQNVDYFDAAGATSVTSDLDISTGGINTELAVQVYNEEFRKEMGTSLDPGTVFDLNVYAKDFIFGGRWSERDTLLRPKGENEDLGSASLDKLKDRPADLAAQQAADQQNQAVADRKQDVFALTHIARFLVGGEWTAYAKQITDGIADPVAQDEQAKRLQEARAKADEFEATLQRTIGRLVATDSGLRSLGTTSSWSKADGGNEYANNAKRMRAANAVYEEKLVQVKILREQIAALAASAEPTDIAQLRLLMSQVAATVSEASLYANEVYGSAGATVHAVVAVQGGRKRQKANEAEAERTAKGEALKNDKGEAHEPRLGTQTKVTVEMSTEAWKQAFTDNVGDVLKDYLHYGHSHGTQPTNYPYAAFKMGKYVDRVVDAFDHLQGAMSAEAYGRMTAMPELKRLRDLGDNHVKAKAGPSGDDPKLLADEANFKSLKTQAHIDSIKADTLSFSAAVRKSWATEPAPVAPAAPTAAVASPPASAGPAPASVPTPAVPAPMPGDVHAQVPALAEATNTIAATAAAVTAAEGKLK